MTYSSDIPTKTLFLDTEPTGRHPPRDTIYEIAIVDEEGRVVLETLINTERPLCDGAQFRGLGEADFTTKPTLRQLWPTIEALVTGCHVVIFNADHDCQYFPKRLTAAGHISCAMERFAPIYGDYSVYHNSYTFKGLKAACEFISYKFEGPPHHALTDALACRAVWQWMDDRDDFNRPLITRLPAKVGA